MDHRARMSPLTAMFLGIFGFGAVAVTAGTATLLYAMRIVDGKAESIIGFAGDTVQGLPELIASLPPAIGDLLHDRRAPDYARQIDVEVKFVASDDYLRPVLTIQNTGDEVVSLLAVRVAALSDDVAMRDWTEVVATPLAVDDDWRGPLMPGATRHVVLGARRMSTASADKLTAAVEISDVRVWTDKQVTRTSSTG